MRIAVVTPTYPPYKGGIGNVAYGFTDCMVKRGYDITILTPDYTRDSLEKSTRTVNRLRPLIRWGNAAFVPQLLYLLRSYDIVHSHTPFIGASLVLILFKLLNRRKLLIVHYHMDLIGKGLRRPIFFMYQQTCIRLLVLVADRIIVTSEDYARHSALKSTFKKHKTKVIAIPNGINFTLFSKPIDNARVREFIPYTLFVGTLDSAHYFKGVSVLLQAWDNVHRTNKNERLILVGDGNLRIVYEQEASIYTSHKSVHFIGSVSEDELVALYQHARVTALPSTHKSEAFGMVLIESIASGTPVIASDLPGVRTLVQIGKTGLLATPGSVSDLSKKIEIVMASSKNSSISLSAKKYDWGNLCDHLEKLYRI